jgi:hypothetical protein
VPSCSKTGIAPSNVVTDEQYKALLHDVVLNPVQSGMCTGPDQWSWSSYRATVGAVPAPRFLDVSGVLRWFDTDPDRARQLYRSSVYARLEMRRTEPRAPDPQGGGHSSAPAV